MRADLNQRLLSKYPLLWNTRLILIGGISLLVNFLFFLFGYLEHFSIGQLSYASMRFNTSLLQFSVLITLLLVIFWLSLYFRNNPLKSFYPLSRFYLFKEYLIIVVILFFSAAAPYSYQVGRYTKVKQLMASIDAAHETEIFCLAQHFLPFELDRFYSFNHCDSLKKRNWTESYPSYNGESADTDTVPLYSNYCFYMNPAAENERENLYQLNKRARSWIANKSADSIRWVLSETVRLSEKYGGQSKLDINAQVEDCLDDTVRRIVFRNNPGDRYSSADYVDVYPIGNAIGGLDGVTRNYWNDWLEVFLGFMYYVLCASIAIFTFRITRRRVWFIAIIALGILVVIFTILGVGGFTADMIYVLYILVWIASLLYAALNISFKSAKRTSGIALLWFTWALPSVPVSTFAYLADKSRDRSGQDVIGHDGQYIYQPTFSDWVSDHWTDIHIGTIIMSILVIGLIIAPMARKWQACPEE